MYDQGASKKAGQTTLYIHIRDVNDQFPTLDRVSTMEIESSAANGSILHCFNPVDADFRSNFLFFVTKGADFVSVERFRGCVSFQKRPSKSEEICVEDLGWKYNLLKIGAAN